MNLRRSRNRPIIYYNSQKKFMTGKLVIISAPSGAGKTSIVSYLLTRDLLLEFSVSATTRKPRANETHGKEYYFLSTDNFKTRIKKKEFVEWEEVYEDNYYGTLKSEIERVLSHKKNLIFDVDVKGGINLKNIFGKRAISIFIMPPSIKELEKRLLARGSDEKSRIKVRVEKALEEIKLADQFDQIVINDNLETARSEVYEMVNRFLKK
jgi:guanylate kinase